MRTEKSMIEIVKIDGLDVAIERQSGNCKVNLTNMAKRYGKQPIHWLRTREAQEFLAALTSIRKCSPKMENINPVIGKTISDDSKSELRISSTQNQSEVKICTTQNQSEPQIFGTQSSNLITTRKGNSSDFEQGTWCTDYRIAFRFAMWLDQYFAILVIETFIRVINGEFILDEEGCIITSDGRKWVSRETYCAKLGRNKHSFSGLKAHYPHHFEKVNGQHVMSREFFLHQSKKTNFEEERISFKRPVIDKNQLSFEFSEYEEVKEG